MITLPDYRLTDNRIFGKTVAHSPLAIWCMENVLNEFAPKMIIEIGTGHGGLSIYLGAWAIVNNAQVFTFDIKDHLDDDTKITLINDLNVMVECRDVFGDIAVEQIKTTLSLDKPVLLYCDGGNKQKELMRFAPTAKAGDVVGCHDYGTEVAKCLIDPFMERHGFVKCISPKVSSDLYLLQMFWTKVGI